MRCSDLPLTVVVSSWGRFAGSLVWEHLFPVLVRCRVVEAATGQKFASDVSRRSIDIGRSIVRGAYGLAQSVSRRH